MVIRHGAFIYSINNLFSGIIFLYVYWHEKCELCIRQAAQWCRIEGAVFGHVETHKNLVDRICSDLGIKLLLLIWNIESTQIFWNMRFRNGE